MSETTIASVATHVGDDVQRVDDTVKLTGGAMYASDMVFAGMLHAQVKKSPHARAKIVAIDTSKAESLPASTRSSPAKSSTTASACTSWTRTSWPRTSCGTSARLSPPWRPKAWISPAGPST